MIAKNPERCFQQDPKQADFYNDPYSLYARMHKIDGPVYWEDYGFWCLTKFDAVSNLLKDKRFARLPPADMKSEACATHLNDFAEVEKHSLLALEPPKHTRIRQCVNKAFANRQVEMMQPEIGRLANELIDNFDSSAPVDLLQAYATPLPVAVIAKLLGVPQSECDNLLAWSHAMVRVYTLTQTHEEELAANAAAADFRDLLQQLIQQRRKSPQQDLLSQLVSANTNALSDEEIISTAVLLLNAGHEATVHQIGNACKSLLETGWPLNWMEDDTRTDRVVAEAMRFDAPLHLFLRFAQEQVELHQDVVVEKGEQIALLLGAANRDPGRFTDSDRFNPERTDANNVSLGAGLHFCVGAQLAKLELRIALSTLFKRLPKLSLAETPQFQNSYHFHGLKTLLINY